MNYNNLLNYKELPPLFAINSVYLLLVKKRRGCASSMRSLAAHRQSLLKSSILKEAQGF